MNSAEKKFLYLALFLFALGGVSRLGIFDEFSSLEMISLPESNYEETAATDSVVVEYIDTVEARHALPESEFKSKSKKKKAPAFPIPINTASKEDLCFIKGVGPALAQKIIDHREAKGNFRAAKDLEKVSGIGSKKRQAIEEFVRFD